MSEGEVPPGSGSALEPEPDLPSDETEQGWVARFRAGFLASLALSTPSAVFLSSGHDLGVIGALTGASVLLAVAALCVLRGGASRPWVLVAAVVGIVALGPALGNRPGWTFVLGFLVLGLLSWGRRQRRDVVASERGTDEQFLWGVLTPAGASVLLVALSPAPHPVEVVSSTVASFFVSLVGLHTIYALIGPGSGRVNRVAAWGLLMVVGLATGDHGLRGLLWWTAGASALLVPGEDTPSPLRSLADAILGRPELLLTVSFAGAIFVGTVLLSVPAAVNGEAPLALIDAFFTAVSATCVTGLVVVDTATTFSGFGEVVVLVLIQLGGLGMMTFSTAALVVLQRRLSLRFERSVSDLFVSWEGSSPARAVRHILLITLVVEGLGALLLAARFSTAYGESIGPALWRGLFTAVSAFCNAGFALQSDSLVQYQSDAFVILVVATLIFLAALGPVVLLAIAESRAGRSIPVRLMLVTSTALVVVGTGAFAAFEWSGVLEPLALPERLTNALFQSVTLRTAGFNSVDIQDLKPQTQAFMLVMMFIGGSPGSTSGGIKTTTFAVILLSVAATVRGRAAVVYRSRRISHDTFYRATAILVFGASSVFVLWSALLLTQPVGPLAALFETVSALGTVGLSTGVTGHLDEVGKLLVSLGMFAGRLGPLTVLLLFASGRRPPRWRYPEIGLPVG